MFRLMTNAYIKWQAWSATSINRKIFSAATIIATMTLVTRLVFMIKEQIVAAKFGLSDSLDAFLLAFTINLFITNVITGALNASVIPIYIRVKERDGKIAAENLICNCMGWSLLTLSGITVVMYFTAPSFLPALASGFDKNKIELTLNIFIHLLPMILLYGIKAIWSSILNAGYRFALVAVTPILTPLTTAILLLAVTKNVGTDVLVIGTILGAILENIILGTELKRRGASLLPKWHRIDHDMVSVAKQFLPMVSATVLMCSTTVVDQAMAAMLGPGSVSALNYGYKVVGMIIGLATSALGTAVIPFFSSMVAKNNWLEINNIIKRYLVIIFVVTIPITIVLCFMSKGITHLLFERGTFTSSDTTIVSNVQIYFALQIPFFIACILIVKLISSMLLNYVLLIGNVVSVIVNVVLNYVFMRKYGVGGIALSTSFVYIISFIFLFSVLLKVLKRQTIIYKDKDIYECK